MEIYRFFIFEINNESVIAAICFQYKVFLLFDLGDKRDLQGREGKELLFVGREEKVV